MDALILLVRHADPDDSTKLREVLLESVQDEALRPCVMDGDQVTPVDTALVFRLVELQGVGVDEVVAAGAVDVLVTSGGQVGRAPGAYCALVGKS
jgi:hypothetical protein